MSPRIRARVLIVAAAAALGVGAWAVGVPLPVVIGLVAAGALAALRVTRSERGAPTAAADGTGGAGGQPPSKGPPFS